MSWPVAALREMKGQPGCPNHLDVAYYAQTFNECGLKDRFGFFQYGVDYNTIDDRQKSIDRLRKYVDEQLKKHGHENVHWVLLPGGDL